MRNTRVNTKQNKIDENKKMIENYKALHEYNHQLRTEMNMQNQVNA